LHQLSIGLIDRLQQVVKAGGFIDGPMPRERTAKYVQVSRGEQPYGNDLTLSQVTSRVDIGYNARKSLKCHFILTAEGQGCAVSSRWRAVPPQNVMCNEHGRLVAPLWRVRIQVIL
jgi:hypothetical protein